MHNTRKGKLDRKAVLTLALIGRLIAAQPNQVQKLLKTFGIKSSRKATPQALTKDLLYATATKGKLFHKALTKLIADQLSPVDDYDSYAHDQHYDGFLGQLAGVVGSIGKSLGGMKGKKKLRAEASQQIMSNLFAYKANEQKMIADQQAAEQNAKEKAAQAKLTSERNIGRLKVVGLVLGAGVIGWIAIKQFSNRPSVQMVT